MKRIAFPFGTITGFAVAALLSACMIFKRPPSEPKAYERTQASTAQLYTATFSPAESIKVGKLHAWKINVASANGAPIHSAKITVDGGMPQHGHGLPTKPQVTPQLAAGQYLVEGMKFNMGGWWVVKFRIASATGSDSVVFNLKL